jgi:hypothetical protein
MAPRRVLIGLLVLVAASRVAAADDARPAGQEVRAINTVCPVDGKKIDPKLAPVRVVVDGDPPREIWVGICSEEDRKKIAADPRLYGKAAIANKKAEPAK